MPETSEDTLFIRHETLRMTSTIVSSYVGANPIQAEGLPDLIRLVHATLVSLSGGAASATEERPRPAVAVSKSVTADYIICLEDGRKLKMLKRYLRSRYGLSPDAYRRRWGLSPDYPMVAPNYTTTRSQHAKRIGLGKGVRKAR
jgi:predicted transcriptional regulator